MMMWFLPSLKNLETAVRLALSLMISHHVTAQLQSKNSGRLVLFDTRSAHAIDSDDCEEIDAEEDGDDHVVSKKRNKAKKPISKKPKSYLTKYPFPESTRPVYKDCIQVNNTYTNVHINGCITTYILCRHIYMRHPSFIYTS